MEILKGNAINDGITIGKMVYFSGALESISKAEEELIVLSEELSPNEVLGLSKLCIGSFVMKNCSDNSHAAILTRTMDMPSLFHIEVQKEWHGKRAIVDGYEGVMIVEPDPETLLHYQSKKEEKQNEKRLLYSLRGKKTETKSARQVKLCANINKISDLENAVQNDAEGVFFKTEFLYIDSADFPSEEEQFKLYKQVATRMKGKRAVIRTIDIGADKKADYFNLEEEENPALGLRGIRLCLAHKEMFTTQLRAILRASVYGDVAIMLPMIVSVKEVLDARRIIEDAKGALRAEGVAFREDIPLGIMIETPASVIISDELAQVVDFFSIGTNDLIQYTLAADRQNARLTHVYDPYHPAIMRSIQFVIDSAHRRGIDVGISGELGADMTLTEQLVEWGIDVLAVSPAKILPLRKAICEMN